MRTIFTIALNDLTIFFRARGNLIGLIVLPLAITVAVGWANSGRGGPSVLRADVIDLDQSAQSTDLLTQLRAVNPALRLCPMDNDADDLCRLDGAPLTEILALERVRNEWVDGLLIIPSGYGAAIVQAQPVQLPYYSTDDPALPGPVRQAVESVLQQVNGATVAARVGASFLGILAPLLI
jgi:hypothetical protein